MTSAELPGVAAAIAAAMRSVCVERATTLRAPYQNDEGEGAHGQVLLVANATVNGDQDLEVGVLRDLQESAVAERVPALGLCGVDRVPCSQQLTVLEMSKR